MANKPKAALPSRLLAVSSAELALFQDSVAKGALEPWARCFKSFKGRVVCTGVGKSAPAAQLLAESLATLGEDARFVHPVEALHGALGRFGHQDLLVAFSASGQTREPLRLMRWAKEQKATVGLVSAEANSPMAKDAQLTLLVGTQAAEPIPLLPLVKSGLLLNASQALVALWYDIRPLKVPDLARFQPDTALARIELLKVADALRMRQKNPLIGPEDTLQDALSVLTKEGLGAVSVVNEAGQCVGILTDGDARRLLQKSQGNLARLFLTPVSKAMTPSPRTVRRDSPAQDAIALFEEFKVTVLPVTDAKGKVVGMVHLHDLVELGFNL